MKRKEERDTLQLSTLNSQSTAVKLLFIVGPTASGKSAAAMKIARIYDGEIICADSQTLRKELDIGTAKPSKKDQIEIPHHMVDVIEPYADFSVTEFQAMAQKHIVDIQNRGKLPIVVGGTGLYIDSLFFDYDLDSHTENNEYKKILQKKTVTELQALVKSNNFELPENSENPRHLIGVLLRKNSNKKNEVPIKNARMFGLLPSDDELKRKIASRADSMFSQGFVDEVRDVIDKHGEPPSRLDAIGYPIALEYIKDVITFDEMRELFTRGHWQYVRRQKSWFKRNEHIEWSTTSDEMIKKIEQVLPS